ncbi:MurR/RpiR family transcriptional regulator [Alkalicoccus halolimnae]|uniref:MurR/RpiR family transcriptional regulator n=1 Tax=Alkalicoccus halolimnae TaxID=1667239 RepID=A0A5C7F1K3_9BACI|nr:MurR/RpiR family transcriptional regulator [Alkalicoccus halolimnae]TXF83612.1 MurR/RpiR family transcriptional regulator [Alkalicoccus halolimnae]
MSLEELINTCYDELNDNDMHILKYILNHKEACRDMGINDLAEASLASRSSIHRLTKKLRFSGYSEFKVFLKWEGAKEEETGNHMQQLETDIQATLKNLASLHFEPICEKLYGAGRIFIYGTGTAQLTCAREAQRLFALQQTFVTIIYDEVEFETMLKAMQPEDVVIIISLSGDTPSLLPHVQHLTARGITFISITNLKNNKLAQMSPFSIYAATSPSYTKNGEEIISFIPFTIALEALFRKYISYKEEQTEKN